MEFSSVRVKPMRMCRMLKLAVLLTAFWVAGCAHVMSEAGLKSADRSICYADIARNPEGLVGKVVLVGGQIAGTRGGGDVIMLEVVQLGLLNNGVPDEFSPSGGRFLAVSSELLDPLIYTPGKFVTIIGEVKGKRIQKIDGADYPFPLVAVRELRLFRPSEPFATYTGNPYQQDVDDRRFRLRPPGQAIGEPRQGY